MPGDLLHRGLEPERPVGGVEQLGVVEVDLELAAAELVVGRGHLQAGVAQVAQHGAAGRPAGRPCGRRRTRCRASSAYRRQRAARRPARRGRTPARGRRPRCRPELGEPARHPARHSRGDSGAGAPSGVTVSPRHQAAPGSHGSGGERRQVGVDVDVGQARLEAALAPAPRRPSARCGRPRGRTPGRGRVAVGARRPARRGRGPRRSGRGTTRGPRRRPCSRSRATHGARRPRRRRSCAAWCRWP